MEVYLYLDDVVVAHSREEAVAAELVIRVLRRAQVRMHLGLDRVLVGASRPVTYLGRRLVVDYRQLQ